jgi:hypothetical protein
MFTYQLFLEDGSPAEPLTFATSVPDWHTDDKFMVRPGEEYRIVELQPERDPTMHGTWIVRRII